MVLSAGKDGNVRLRPTVCFAHLLLVAAVGDTSAWQISQFARRSETHGGLIVSSGNDLRMILQDCQAPRSNWSGGAGQCSQIRELLHTRTCGTQDDRPHAN